MRLVVSPVNIRSPTLPYADANQRLLQGWHNCEAKNAPNAANSTLHLQVIAGAGGGVGLMLLGGH